MDGRHIKRYGIFFFFDADGVVDNYIPYMLEHVSKSLDGLTIVCNEFLNEDGRLKLSKFSDDIFIRKNFGYDVWAYKEAMQHIGRQHLSQYDEVLFFNFTLMGPFYDIEPMFEEMSARKNDFWGLTINHGSKFDPYGLCRYGYLPVYLPTNFIVVKKRLFTSECFETYWSRIPPINSVGESICYHEAVFTKHFCDLGFSWDVFADTREMLDHSNYPMIREPLLMVAEKHVPFVKRKTFFYEYEDLLSNTNGRQAKQLLQFIREKTDYDVDLIWENMLRTQNGADLLRTMSLFYVLDPNKELVVEKRPNQKIAIICHIYYLDLAEQLFQYLKKLPDVFDLYITTTSKIKQEKIQDIFSKKQWKNLHIIIVNEKGREVSALIIAMRTYILRYDYACFIHSKKVARFQRSVKGRTMLMHCLENLIPSASYFDQIIQLFETNPRLGVLSAPPVYFGDYFKFVGNEWGKDFSAVKTLACKLGVHTNISENKEPLTPTGFMFWFRPEALQSLFTYSFKHSMFSNSDTAATGNNRRVLQKTIPFASQAAGFYSAYTSTPGFLADYTISLHHMLRSQNERLWGFFPQSTHRELLENISDLNFSHKQGKLKIYIKAIAKEILPQRIVEMIRRWRKRRTLG